jgi:hypothetical protein
MPDVATEAFQRKQLMIDILLSTPVINYALEARHLDIDASMLCACE